MPKPKSAPAEVLKALNVTLGQFVANDPWHVVDITHVVGKALAGTTACRRDIQLEPSKPPLSYEEAKACPECWAIFAEVYLPLVDLQEALA